MKPTSILKCRADRPPASIRAGRAANRTLPMRRWVISGFVPFAAALASAVLACSSGAETAESAAAVTASPAKAAPKGTRDLRTLDLCALLPLADVAARLGYDPASGSADSTMGQSATDCTYSFERGDGSSDYVILWAYPPEMWAPMLDEKKTPVAGLGDAAYSSPLSSFAQMNVLLEGDLYLDARANTPAQARALVELAIERLPR